MPPITAALGTGADRASSGRFYGWNEIVAVAGEVANPRRNLPLALILGTGLVTLLYVGVNAAFLKVIPAAEMAGDRAARHRSPRRACSVPARACSSSLAVTAAAIGCTSAGLVPAPRIVYALAKDGLFPKAFARVHPRFRTPSFGIVVQAVWMSLLCLSGRYDQLYTYATFFVILAYAATGIALFVFRRRRPDLPRPYRCWGYPVVPFVFVASSLVLAINTVRVQPVETLAGIGILAAGTPLLLRAAPTRPFVGRGRGPVRRRLRRSRPRAGHVRHDGVGHLQPEAQVVDREPLVVAVAPVVVLGEGGTARSRRRRRPICRRREASVEDVSGGVRTGTPGAKRSRARSIAWKSAVSIGDSVAVSDRRTSHRSVVVARGLLQRREEPARVVPRQQAAVERRGRLAPE